MNIKIDEKKILKEVLEFNNDLHQRIKDKVRDRLVDDIVGQIEAEFINKKWSGNQEIWDSVLDKVSETQDEVTKNILKEFYDSYRHGKKDITILKKLKELLLEE